MEPESPEAEVQRLRSLLRRVYPYCLPHPDNEEVLAELEREVLRIAVAEGRYGPDGPIPLCLTARSATVH
jgi:hypothetical protein